MPFMTQIKIPAREANDELCEDFSHNDTLTLGVAAAAAPAKSCCCCCEASDSTASTATKRTKFPVAKFKFSSSSYLRLYYVCCGDFRAVDSFQSLDWTFLERVN